MASISDQILIGVRGWIKLGAGVANDRVVPADDSGTRPDLPYLTVRLFVQDIPTQWDEPTRSVNQTSGDLDENVVGHRRGTVQIDGYGRGADDLISLASLSLTETRVKQYLAEQKLTVQPAGGINDLSTLVDDEIEKRFTKDFTILYAVTRSDDVEDGAAAFDNLDTEFEFNAHTFEVD